jgi:ADP-ribosylglycohydrolase
MALSIARILLKHGEIHQDALAHSFGEQFDSSRGYGSGMLFELLPRLRAGDDWRIAAQELFDGGGSFGNGAAMRVAPLGAWFSDDVDQAVTQAALSAEVTHAHPEGIAGAVAVAAATALVMQPRPWPVAELLTRVAELTPASEVQNGLLAARELPLETIPHDAANSLGNGSRVTAQDTVPFCLWIVSQYLDEYHEALWETVSVLGDMDTNCAIVGGIIAARVGLNGIPTEWRQSREGLPTWHLTDGHQYFR